MRLKYCTLGLLFVNVSIGGTLTHFAAPPVLMVARVWDWSTPFMLGHFGWRAVVAIVVSTSGYFLVFRREFAELARRAGGARHRTAGRRPGSELDGFLPVPSMADCGARRLHDLERVHRALSGLFVAGFLIFLGFTQATAAYQSRIDLKPPLLVGFFLAGLVIHGGLQGWWISPVLRSLSQTPLFLSSTLLTAFNDNALITYLATLVPHLDDQLKIAVVEGAVTGGGLTVIANAPNPAGQALLGRFFDGAIRPAGLLLGALPPTIVVIAAFRLL